MSRNETDRNGDRAASLAVGGGAHTRRDLLLKTGAAGAALMIPAALAACGGSSSSGTGTGLTGAAGKATNAEIKHLAWGQVGQAPDNLDIAKSFSGQLASSLGLEGLLGSDSEMKLVPVLARSWSQPELTRYVFDIRKGVRFWDGTPLTVEDVVFSLERHIDESVGSQIGFFFSNVASIEAVSDERIVINLKAPDPTLPNVLALAHIHSKKFADGIGTQLGNPGSKMNVMGTGPYKLTSFTTTGGVDVVRNDAYWGERPRVKSASIEYFEKSQTMLLAARSGAIDGGFGFPLSEAGSWANLSGVDAQFLKETGLTTVFLSFDMEAEPWSDIHVRRAIAHCADTPGYTNAFTGGQAAVASAIVPTAQWTNVATPSEVDAVYRAIPQYPFSVGRAREELAKSSYPDGFSATVTCPGGWLEERALVSLSQKLKQIGIDLEVETVTEIQWLTTLSAHKGLGLYTMKFVPDYNDPSDYMMIVYPSANATANAYNAANFKNATVDRLLQEQSETQNDRERVQLLGEVLKISGEELPYLPLWWEGPTMAINDKYVYNGLNALYYIQPWLSSIGVSA